MRWRAGDVLWALRGHAGARWLVLKDDDGGEIAYARLTHFISGDKHRPGRQTTPGDHILNDSWKAAEYNLAVLELGERSRTLKAIETTAEHAEYYDAITSLE